MTEDLQNMISLTKPRKSQLEELKWWTGV